MTRNDENNLSAENVCRVLLDLGLLSGERQKEILSKREVIRRKLEKSRAMRQASAPSKGQVLNPITIIDVITSLKLERANDSSKILDEEIIFQALARAWKIPYKKIDPLKLDLNLVTTTIPHTFAMKHLVLPIAIKQGALTVATPNPFNAEVMEDIARVSHLKVRPVVSTKTDIIKMINEFFGFKRSIAAAENEFSGPIVDLGNLEQFVHLRSADELPSNDQHIVNAVDHLFSYAFDQRASDVHIEPKREKSIVRLRIDGALNQIYELPKNVHSAVISRIKNLARLDMAEKRKPQDGRIKMDKQGVEAEIRVSSVPVAFGEKLVMRIMDPDITIGSTTYSAGSEIWAFIPSDLLTRLKELEDSTNHTYFMDGFSALHRSTTRNANNWYNKTLVFGERRGGRSYWALDVSDPDPSLWTVKWHLEGGVFSNELGYSWSKPTFAEIRTGSGTTDFTDVIVFGGGYDMEEDNYPEPWNDDDNDGKYEQVDGETYTDENGNGSYDYYNPDKNDTGRGIFVVNLSDGSHRFAANYAAAGSTSGTSQFYTDMKWCFPADPTVIDLTSDLLIYAADVYGQVWKVTYNYYRSPEQWAVKRIFQANPGSDQVNVAPPIDTAPSLDNTDYGRKMFYAPDVSYLGTDWTNYPVLYFGTGDRSHPRYVPNYHNRFYSISDTDTLADETNLLNLTCNELDDNADVDQDGDVDIDDDAAKDDVLDILYGLTSYIGGISRGWYRIMGKQGDCTQDSTDHGNEKILSRPNLFFGNVFFTSYQPIFDDPCNPNGNAFIYALDYSTGAAALDLNLDNTTEATLADTYEVIQNSSIPSGVRILTREGPCRGAG